MKKYRYIIPILVAAMLFSACVSKSTYEQAQSDLVKTQNQIQSLEDEKLSLQGTVDKLQSDYEGLQGQNDTLQNEIDSNKKTIESLRADLETSKSEVETAQDEIGSLHTEVTNFNCLAEASQESIDKAGPYLDVLAQLCMVVPEDADDEWWFLWILELNTLVDKVGDPALETELDIYYESEAANSHDVFATFVLNRIRKVLEADVSCPEPEDVASGAS